MNLPKISIIIPSFKPSAKPFLDAAVASAYAQTYPNREIIVVSPKSYAPRYEGVRTVSPESEDYPLAHNVNFGVKSAARDSEYFMILNDDCVMQKECVVKLLASFWRYHSLGMVMPISNDTNLGAYNLQTAMGVGAYDERSLLRLNDMINIPNPYHPGLIFRDHLCLFAFMIERSVFQQVGEWDEQLLGMDDIDYSIRMRQAGYLNAIELSALCFHAQGVSTSSKSDEWRKESEKRFNEKWGSV